MKILFVSPVIHPFFKGKNPVSNETDAAVMTADLSQALARRGDSVTVISVLPEGCQPGDRMARRVTDLKIEFNGRNETVPVYEGRLDDSSARALLLEMKPEPDVVLDEDLIADPSLSEERAEWCKFFGKAVLAIGEELGLTANVVHFHGDAVSLALVWPQQGENSPDALVVSFYDPQKEGVFPASAIAGSEDSSKTAAQTAVMLSSAVLLPGPGCLGQIAFSKRRLALKSALVAHPRVYGIMGGVDSGKYNPWKNPNIKAGYDAENLEGKKVCKRFLQSETGLSPRQDVPLVVVFLGTDREDGTNLIAETVSDLVKEDMQFVFVGDALPGAKRRIKAAVEANSSRVVSIPHNEKGITHLLAAADIVLAADEWAPWGRVALLGMAMGCVPVVHSTGGYSDVVVDWDPETRTGGGFKYRPSSSEELLSAIKRAGEVFRHPEDWDLMVAKNMKAAPYWPDVIERFRNLYESLVEEN